jgi:hypothetical protein
MLKRLPIFHLPCRLAAIFLTMFMLAFIASPVHATITITAAPFYVAYNSGAAPSAYLYNQITGGANGIDGMYITTEWDSPGSFIDSIDCSGVTIGSSFEIEAATKDEAIRNFLLMVWGGQLTYEGWDNELGDHATITRTYELEQLRGWLRNSIEQSKVEDGWFDGTPIAFMLDSDTTDDDLPIFGLSGYIVTMSGTEPVVPDAPQFIEPEYEWGEGYFIIPNVEEVTYYINGENAYGNEYFFYQGDTVTITAEPGEGYHFPGGTVTSWTYTFGPAPSVQIVFEQLSPHVFNGQTVTGGGWAADDNEGAPVERVEVWVDGNYQCDASLDIERPDVADDTGRYDWSFSGFGFSFSATGLSVGQHTVEVIAYNSQENAASASLTFTVAPTIPIPTGFGGMAFGVGGVMLSWNLNPDSGVTYELERKTGNGNFVKIADLTEGVYGFTDSGLSPDTTYTYRLRAKTALGYLSGYSTEITITTEAMPSSLIIRALDGQYWTVDTGTWEISPVSAP